MSIKLSTYLYRKIAIVLEIKGVNLLLVLIVRILGRFNCVIL